MVFDTRKYITTIILDGPFKPLIILCITYLLGKEDDVEDYEYDDGLDDTEEMTSYERVMRGKRSAEDYDDYDEDYDDEDIEDYDDLVNDGEDEDEEESEEEEEDEDYTDGEPITKNIADKDEKIKGEL